MKSEKNRILRWIKAVLSGWPAQNGKLSLKKKPCEEAETTSVNSEEKFRLVFESANEGKSITLPTGEIDVNKAFCDMLGYTREELRNKRWQDITPSEDIGSTQLIVDLLLQGKKDSARFTKRYTHKNGPSIWADVNIAMHRDSDRNPLFFITTVIDITERKRAEATLNALSKRYEAILASVPDIIMEVDNNKTYTWANEAGKDFFGDDVIGKKAAFYFEGEQETYEIVQPLFQGNENIIYVESWQRRKDGEKRLLAWWCRVLKDIQGNVSGALSTARDITKHKRAEDELRRSESRLREVQEMAYLGHWRWDVKTGAVEWSEEVYKIFHLDPKEFTPRIDSILALSPWPEDHERDKELITRAMESHDKGSYEQRFLRPDKSIGYYYSTFQGSYDEEGNLLFIIGTVMDITERKRAEEALVERNALFAKISSQVPGMLYQFVRRPDGTHAVSFSSDGVKELFGCSPDDVRNNFVPILKAIVPEDRNKILQSIEESAKNLSPWMCEYRVKLPGEPIKWLLGNSLPEKMTDGTIVWSGYNTDITERKLTEAELQESEKLYHSLFENMTSGFAYCRMTYGQEHQKDFIFLEVNRTFEALLGLKDVAGRKVSEIFLGIQQSDAEVFEILDRVALTGKPEKFEYYFEAVKQWFSVSVYSPEKEYFVTIFDVITERKQAEAALKEHEKEFRRLSQEFHGLLDAIPDSLMLLDRNHKVVWANKGVAESLGKPLDEIVGQHCFALWYGRTAACDPCPVIRGFEEGIPVNVIVTSPDNRVWDLRTIPLINEEGRTVNIIVVKRDITEHRKLEEQLRQVQKIEAVGQLAGGVAHDFNNILSAIIGYAHLMLMKMPQDEPQRASVQEILDASQRAAVLTRSLLAFSKKQVVNLSYIDLNMLVQRFEKFLMRLLREDIELNIICAQQLLNVMVDSTQIEQVLMNLATNARDAMSDGGRLTIETRLATQDDRIMEQYAHSMTGEYALLLVTDTGTGMDENTKRKAFDPFFTTKEVGKGTGLGLAMVYGIVKKHNGYITISTEIGQGTTFKIYFPLVETAPAEAREKEPVAASAQGGTETVLVVEDDPDVRKLTSTVLKHSGYTVLEAIDGEDAIFQYVDHKNMINLVILDAIMPKKNGWEAYEAIRTITPGVKVIFMSGYSEEILNGGNIAKKGLTYLPKPITPSVLLKKVREVLDTKNP